MSSAASVRDRLKNLAQKRKDDFQVVLSRYAVERFLVRLSRSEFAERFIVKGASLFFLWLPELSYLRVTRDLDLLGWGRLGEGDQGIGCNVERPACGQWDSGRAGFRSGIQRRWSPTRVRGKDPGDRGSGPGIRGGFCQNVAASKGPDKPRLRAFRQPAPEFQFAPSPDRRKGEGQPESAGLRWVRCTRFVMVNLWASRLRVPGLPRI